jgi:hypothetical protein
MISPDPISMKKPISIALLLGGAILIIYGFGASNSVGSSVSRTFTGSPTDRTVWLLVAGFAAVIVGLSGVLRGSRSD